MARRERCCARSCTTCPPISPRAWIPCRTTTRTVLLDVRYTGESRHEPDLGALAVALGALGGRVNFVHGGIDRIQGHAQGRLVVSAQLRASGADQAGLRAHVDALVAGARRHADKVEVLGYV